MKFWRMGQIQEQYFPTFKKENKLSFNWLDSKINYRKEKDIKKFNGWTCINLWVNKISKGDVIFLMNKYEYAGIAIVEDVYKYKEYDMKLIDWVTPGIPVKYLHALSKPVIHDLTIKQTAPKTFYYVNGAGFNLFRILTFIRENFPDVYNSFLKYVRANATPEKNKISKVCWNDRDWRMPSGKIGKDDTKNTFEGKHGYGHEEWINNKVREIDGFCYGFLQTLNLKSDKHVDRIYDITLIANDRNGIFYRVGQIKNAICISKDESEFIYSIYERNGWLEEMTDELIALKADFKDFLKTPQDILFNLKFSKADIIIYPDKMPLKNSEAIKNYRYKLLDLEDYLEIEDVFDFSGEGDDEDDDKSTGRRKRKINVEITYDPIHDKIQNEVKKILRKSKEYKKVKSEKNRVDLSALTNDNKWHYYEIKSYGTPKKCIRAAMGQLFEYSFWPNLRKADKLIILSDNPADPDTKLYMNFLRKTFNLNLYYQCFTFPNQLSDLI